MGSSPTSGTSDEKTESAACAALPPQPRPPAGAGAEGGGVLADEDLGACLGGDAPQGRVPEAVPDDPSSGIRGTGIALLPRISPIYCAR